MSKHGLHSGLATTDSSPPLMSAREYQPSADICTWLLSRLDVSAATYADYGRRFMPFIDFLREHGLHEDTFIRYKRYLAQDSTLKVSTKNKKLTIARMILRELHRRGKLAYDITAGVKGFTQTKKHKQNGLSDEDMAALKVWIGVNKSASLKNLRITCMLMLLAYHGLRQIELCRLGYEDLDLTNNQILVHGKARDDKEPVHIHSDVAYLLRQYCDAYNIHSGSLFFSVSNNGSRGRPLTTRGLRATLMQVFHELGIAKNIHGLRHWYVTRLVQEFPGDLFLVMSFTRHRSLDQLQVYNDAYTHAEALPRHDTVFSHTLV